MKSDGEEQLHNFRREANLLGALSHPSIVRMYGIAMDALPYIMVMELMGYVASNRHLCRSLLDLNKNLIETKGSLPWKIRFRLAKEIASGLEYLHGRKAFGKGGIIYRDLKSANILLASNLQAKLTDFGTARWREDTTQRYASIGAGDVGSVRWHAPELFDHPHPGHSQFTDIYALGMVFWEIADMHIPFHEIPSNTTVVAAIGADRDKRPVIPPEVPSAFRSIIESSWTTSPTTRQLPTASITQLCADPTNISTVDSELRDMRNQLTHAQGILKKQPTHRTLYLSMNVNEDIEKIRNILRRPNNILNDEESEYLRRHIKRTDGNFGRGVYLSSSKSKAMAHHYNMLFNIAYAEEADREKYEKPIHLLVRDRHAAVLECIQNNWPIRDFSHDQKPCRVILTVVVDIGAYKTFDSTFANEDKMWNTEGYDCIVVPDTSTGPYKIMRKNFRVNDDESGLVVEFEELQRMGDWYVFADVERCKVANIERCVVELLKK